jgi:predicted XRE-type DNA-binding protein
MRIQQRIKTFMSENGMNQGQFASAIHASPYEMTKIMQGDMDTFSRHAGKIFRVLGI